MEETKASPRALSRCPDQLRKQKSPLRSCFLFLEGCSHTADRHLNHPITEEEKEKKMKGRMFGGMSFAWCFLPMPVGPVCLHRSLGVWNSYQMPLTEPYIGFEFCSCFIIYLNNFNSHGCFYYLSPERADIRKRKQTLKDFRK